MYSGIKKRNTVSSGIVYMAVLIFCILHLIQVVVTFVSWQCITVHYNKLEESLIHFDLCYLYCFYWDTVNTEMQNHSSWSQHKQNLHYWCCHNVTVWYNCFVFICYLAVSFQLIMTLPCSAACLLCPDASREVQSTFTPKIIFYVPLSPSAPSREGEGLPVTLGGVIQMVHQMCGRSTWWEGGAGVKRATDCSGCLGAGWSVFMCASVGECTKSALRQNGKCELFEWVHV